MLAREHPKSEYELRPRRCQSFNTAQLRILTESDPDLTVTEANNVSVDNVRARDAPDGPDPLSRPPSRGRNPQLAGNVPRSQTSTSVLPISRSSEPCAVRRTIRSASPSLPSRFHSNRTSESSSACSMDLNGDEFEDMNILGMHSPLDPDRSSFLHESSEDEDDDDDDEEEDSLQDDDEDMSDGAGSEQGEDDDPMEIQGHW